MDHIIKDTYQHAINKKAVQKDLAPLLKRKYSHVVGLAGPDINNYLAHINSLGINKVTIYENNNMQLLRQIQQFKSTLPILLYYNDIMMAAAKQKATLYDLDFCFSAIKAFDYVQKFKNDDTITTVSMRPLNFHNSIKTYLKALFNISKYELEELDITKNFRKYLIHTIKGSVIHHQYKDTSLMLVFTNIKIN